MDASKHAKRKDDDRKDAGKDDVQGNKADGRYEGGRDADQNRQAKEGFGRVGGAAPASTPEGAKTLHHGMEEEE